MVCLYILDIGSVFVSYTAAWLTYDKKITVVQIWGEGLNANSEAIWSKRIKKDYRRNPNMRETTLGLVDNGYIPKWLQGKMAIELLEW